ncbi:MAG TPA: protein kinase [Thermoanaerobaculia bacterium]|nr:protein kinase [Thermoanaerobaculia bacterium]
MPVTAGQRLGPYEILAPLGAGGMGEVWRAHDTRLDRSVAIKLLPGEFAQNAQLKARFEREAKTISQLNHPNICTLYDVGRENGTDYLVMEFVDGETLADRIARGPLPVGDVLRFGVQIAEALDRAHTAGVVHRDLKPGNIMIAKSGAKLLDFGLAKSGAVLTLSADDATVQKSLTQEGTIVGTFQYMSPEQLEGAAVDHRSDIFAFGAVLYEMITGKRAFEGKTKTSLIAAIVGGEPQAISTVQPLAPRALDHVVQKCLAKDRDERWQSARDIAGELQWIAESRSSESAKAPARRRAHPWMLAAVALAAAAIAAAATGLVLMRNRHPDRPMVLSLTMPPNAPYQFIQQAALSPDGNSVAFIARTATGTLLLLRDLGQRDARPLPETAGARFPFWSPDSRSIGFFAEGKLKRIAVAGGPPQTICAAGAAHGGSWSRDGVILFSDGENPLYRVDANGGAPRLVTKLAPGEEGHRWPWFLPDGDHFLFLGDAPRTENHHIKVGSLKDGSARDLFQAVTNAQYVEPGYLLFVRGGALIAQRFDAKALNLTGEPAVVAENVTISGDNHLREFSAAGNGRLIYRALRPEAQITLVDRTGKAVETIGEPRRLGTVFRFSPDQQRIAFDTTDADDRGEDVWVLDRSRGVTSRVTFDPATDFSPTWSPDGTKFVFGSFRVATQGAFMADLANPTSARMIAENFRPETWVGDIIAGDTLFSTLTDVRVYSLKTGRVEQYLHSPSFSYLSPALSPDGRWIAYESDESGRSEVYVEEFPSHARRRQISTGGGSYPNWRLDGRELFYISGDHSLAAADVTNEKSTPKPLFHLSGETYEAAADGEHFLVDLPLEDFTKQPFTVMTNWR